MKKAIKIRCDGSEALSIDSIEDFQGPLKRRSEADIELITRSIEKYGFSFPFFIWRHEGHNFCLDGHGRLQALNAMKDKGADLPEFPVVYIEAKDVEEAKNKLLRMNSTYGQITLEGLYTFGEGIEIDWDDLVLPQGSMVLDAPEMDFDEFFRSAEASQDEPEPKRCPHCGGIL